MDVNKTYFLLHQASLKKEYGRAYLAIIDGRLAGAFPRVEHAAAWVLSNHNGKPYDVRHTYDAPENGFLYSDPPEIKII